MNNFCTFIIDIINHTIYNVNFEVINLFGNELDII